MVFHVSPWFVSFKTQKYLVHTQFQEIFSKTRPILAKNGSRDLKSRYLEITFFYRERLKIVLESWNLAKMKYKMDKKKRLQQIFEILIFGHFWANLRPKMAKNAKIGQKLAQKWPKNQNFKNLLQTFFHPSCTPTWPNFRFLGQFLVLLYKKTWFQDIAILSLGTHFLLKLSSFC